MSALKTDVKISAPWPYFENDEIEAVVDVLRSGKVNYWTGQVGREFEKQFAQYCGVSHAIAVANGTLALELALHGLDIGPGDEVIVPARTFIATASAVVARGATPVCADVDCISQNITADTIRAVLSPKTKAIITVHLAGLACDMDPICQLASEQQLFVIEDCAQAHGARYKGKRVGSFGDVAAFSFCQDKIMTTGGEGGMVVTNDSTLWEKMWGYKDHGKSYQKVYHQEHSPGFRWLHDRFGTNWRLSEMQSAIGLQQLQKLDHWLATRNHHASILDQYCLDSSALHVWPVNKDYYHAYYKYYAQVDLAQLKPGWDRDRIMNTLSARGVPCFSGICPEIYREQAFANAGLVYEYPLENAKQLGETSLMFLVHPTLTEEEVECMGAGIQDVMKEAIV